MTSAISALPTMNRPGSFHVPFTFLKRKQGPMYKRPLLPSACAAALLLACAACVDSEGPTGANANGRAGPLTQIQVSDDGVIRAAMELPFARSEFTRGYEWVTWGRYPEHEELRIPPGRHEVEFEVSGGVYFIKRQNMPSVPETSASKLLDTVYIGIGGIRPSESSWYPALRLQMAYEPDPVAGKEYPRLHAWQAQPYSTGSAHGRVVLTGPGRIVFNRHYNSGWWRGLEGGNWPDLGYLYEPVQDQRVTLTIRPLSGLKLDCEGDLGPNLVTRGESIVCTATVDGKTPTGTLSDIRWSFRDDDGHLIEGPPEPTWDGPMAIGGVVTVSASLDGQPLAAKSVTVVVRKREWLDVLPPAIVLYESCPRRTDTCPQTDIDRQVDSGITSLPLEGVAVPPLTPIVEGPNSGWWYIGGKDAPITLPAPIIRFNPQLFDPNSRFYARRRTCVPADMQKWSTEHENVHVTIAQERATEGWVNVPLESRMRFAGVQDRRFGRETTGFIIDRLRDMLDPRHKKSSRYPTEPHCFENVPQE